MSDTLADMITRIRNGQKAQKISVKAIYSKLNLNVCNVLKNEGYIDGFQVEGENKKGYNHGFTGNYVKVKAPWDPALTGTTLRVRLTEIDSDGLVRMEPVSPAFAI